MNRVWKAAMVVATAALISACGGGDSDDELLPAGAVRALHASPDAPNVDIYVNSTLRVADAPFQAASRNLRLLPGEYQVDVYVAGSDPDEADPVLSDTYDIAVGDLVTLIAANNVASIEYLVVPGDATPVTGGNARVDVVHASPSAGVVDIYVTEYGADLPGSTELNDVDFRGIASLGEVPAGTYQVRITDAHGVSVLYDSGPLDIRAGSKLTVVATDAGADEPWAPVDLVVLTGTDNNPIVQDDTSFVRVVHGVPGVPVDVYVNGALEEGSLFDDFQFTETTDGYAELNSMPQIDITLPGDAIGNAVISAQPTLERGAYYTVIANGTAADDGLDLGLVLLADDLTPAEEGEANLRIVHAAPFATGDAADVDVWAAAGDQSGEDNLGDVAGEIPLATALGYQESTAYLPVPENQYTALVTLASEPDATAGVAIDGVATLANTGVYTAIAVGGANETALQLLFLGDNVPAVIE